MYSFRDTISGSGVETTGLAMSFNGIFLEDEIEGYQTLNVGGRELMPNVFEVRSGSGRDGIIPVAKTIPERVLTIQYRLKADTSEEFREKYNLLNYLLRPAHNEEMDWRYKSIEYQANVVTFTDEPDVYYWGYLESAEKVPFDRNDVIGSFTILCPTPWKFTERITVNGVTDGTGSTAIAPDLTIYSYKPISFTFEISERKTAVVFENLRTGQKIRFFDATYFEIGQTITIDFLERTAMNTNGITTWSILMDLDYLVSSFMTFEMRSGDEIRATPNGTFSMTVEGRWL